jgi:3-deoxy-D-arabino-heptulosonate 7-phosphate (DAHP) synthase class II
MPWVMVSIVEVYRKRMESPILLDEKQRSFLRNHAPDAAGGDAALFEGGDCCVSRFRGNGDEQTAGSLRIEEQIAVYLRDAFGIARAIANKIAVVFQAAGEKPFARRFDGAGKIADRGVVNLK